MISKTMHKSTTAKNIVFEQIGKKISTARTEMGLTQAQLAQKIGITQSLYAYYETGRRRLPINTLLEIADILNVYVEDLLPISNTRKKRGPISKIDKELAKVKLLPQKQQRLVLDLIESVANNQ